jgi:hypothetical protein
VVIFLENYYSQLTDTIRGGAGKGREEKREEMPYHVTKLSTESEYQHHFISPCKQQVENQFCNLMDLNTDKVSRPPQAGSKFILRGSTRTGQTPPTHFHIWLSSGNWLRGVVKNRGVSSSRFLGRSKGWGRGLEVWTPLEVVVLVWLTGRWGMTAAWILRGATQMPEGMSRR